MSVLGFRLGILVVAAFCLGGRPADAQSAPAYWNPGWLGFGGNLNAGQGANGNTAGFDSSQAGGFSATRYHFPSGWFVGSERGVTGFGVAGINQPGAFGATYAEGAQFGYTLKNSPVTVYAGFDTFKYDSGLSNSFPALNSLTGTAPAYGVRAGVEFKPTSSLSLSLGAGYTQQSGRIESDTNSSSPSNDSQFGLVGIRR